MRTNYKKRNTKRQIEKLHFIINNLGKCSYEKVPRHLRGKGNCHKYCLLWHKNPRICIGSTHSSNIERLELAEEILSNKEPIAYLERKLRSIRYDG